MERLASGAWIDRRLVRTMSWLTIAGSLAALAFLYAGSSGTLDSWGRPLGTDFSNVWTAGRMVLDGRAVEVYDWSAHYRVQQATHGSEAVPFYGWHYPPPFLLIAAALAALPYLAVLMVWQAASLTAALLVMRRICPDRDTVLVALGSPAVVVCLTHGHNGFLTACLFGAGLVLVDRRPWLAGLCLGLLCYKPQFGLLIPFALAAGGHWRAITAAGATVLGLLAASTFAFGPEIWPAFLRSTELTRTIVLEAGDTGWFKIASAFAAVRGWGGGMAAAYAVQAAIGVSVAAATAWIWRVGAAWELRAGAVMLGSLLATPYVMDYDLVLLGPILAVLVRYGLAHGFRRWELTAYGLAWFMPIAARQLALHALVPAGFLLLALLFGLVARRAAQEERAVSADGRLRPA